MENVYGDVNLYIICSSMLEGFIINLISMGLIRPRGGEGIGSQGPNRGGDPFPDES